METGIVDSFPTATGQKSRQNQVQNDAKHSSLQRIGIRAICGSITQKRRIHDEGK
jgi:hypothetical protein